MDNDSCAYVPGASPVKPVPAARTVPSHRQYTPNSLRLADWTTIGIGGAAKALERVNTEDEFVEAVRAADEAGGDALILGAGSNVVVADTEFAGTVIRDTRETLEVTHDSGCGGVVVRVSAGYPWDQFVATAVANEWMGLESLSGIPGTVGASPVQNIGAYGHEVAATVASVRVWDRLEGRRRTLFASDLGFGYRTSVLKRSQQGGRRANGRPWGATGRWVVLAVEFHTRHASLSAPVQYAELARTLGVPIGERVDAAVVREAVLDIRRGKSMVLDDSNRNTFSAGSFFTNPIIGEDVPLPADAPRYPVTAATNTVKTSAAWLINHAGFERGFGLTPAASLSTDHVLAITNRGGATCADIARLARTVREGVLDRFGVELVPEPVCVGWSL